MAIIKWIKKYERRVQVVPTPLRKTNADRIRANTDEELAEVISGLGDCDTCYLYHRRCSMNISCKDAVLEWLRKECDDTQH